MWISNCAKKYRRTYFITSERFETSIMAEGLMKMQRHHVHLSGDLETAGAVGMRHGKVVILQIAAARMRIDGFVFYRSENGVWLVENVPIQYISKLG